jgi:hypothetical protein
LTCSVSGNDNQKLLDAVIAKLNQAYRCNRNLVVLKTLCKDEKNVLRSHQYNQLQLLDMMSPLNDGFYNPLRCWNESAYIVVINDLSTAEIFLDKIIKNFALNLDFPRSTVVYSVDKKNFLADLTAFNKIVVWSDFEKHHLDPLGLPTSPLVNLVNFNWDELEEYYWALFLKDRNVNYMELKG